MKRLRSLVIGIGCFYLPLLLVLFFVQRSLLFPGAGGSYMSPTELGAQIAIQEVDVPTQDGLTLKAWYMPATRRNLTIVMFHGNGDTMAIILAQAMPYVAAGYGVMLTEYRGYFGMPGAPTENAIYADARAYIQKLNALGVASKQLVLMGHSLGTGIATRMAHEFDVDGLVLSAPYTSIVDVAAQHYPFFPVKLMMLDRFENIDSIQSIHTPLLIVHGNQDRVIPVTNGEAVFAAAPEPKTLKIITAAGHNDLLRNGMPELVLTWLETLPQSFLTP